MKYKQLTAEEADALLKEQNASYPKYIHVGVGEHWVKCGQQFQTNYGALRKEGDKEIIVNNPIEGTCVVCGKLAHEQDCLPRD